MRNRARCDPAATQPIYERRHLRVKLTTRLIESIEPTGDRIVLHDTELRGFQCRVSAAGKKVFYLYYRTDDGQERRPALGEFGTASLEKIRKKAQSWLGIVADGGDPTADRSFTRKSLTMKEFTELYIEDHAKPNKKASSVKSDQSLIDNHILPRFRTRKVASLKRADVFQMHNEMRMTPGAANRTVALMSKMMNLAEKWDMRPDGTNPSPTEFHRLLRVCQDPEKLKHLSHHQRLTSLIIRTADRLPVWACHNKIQRLVTSDDLLQFLAARLNKIDDSLPTNTVQRVSQRLNEVQDEPSLWAFAKDIELWVLEGRSFPTPPIPGNDCLKPLTTRSAMRREAKIMRNCLKDYIIPVIIGECHFYRWNGLERATVELSQTDRGWKISEILGFRNERIARQSEKLIEKVIQCQMKEAQCKLIT